MTRNISLTAMFVAASAAAPLVLTAPAQAAPQVPFPMAPACLHFRYKGDQMVFKYDSGVTVKVPWSTLSPEGTIFPGSGDGHYINPDGHFWQGPVDGSIDGSKLAINATWIEESDESFGDHPLTNPVKGTLTTRITGSIDPASGKLVKGQAVNEVGAKNAVTTDARFDCADQPVVDEPKPVVNEPKPQTPATNNVTVLKNSDVFDAPDGDGNRLGPSSYSLKAGRSLTTAEPCRDNWCLLNIPDAEVPGGKGWVYAGEGFLEVP